MRKLFPVLAVACMLATGRPALAQSLQVSPTLVELSPSAPASTITIRNTGDAPAVAQIRIFHWSQKSADDVLEPARDVVASPPAARIAPGADQVIRIVRPSKAAVSSEGSYRILVDEIPSTAAQQGSAVVLRTQYSIPVFVLPSRPGRPTLNWKLERDGENLRITATNTGDRRSRLVDFSLARDGGEKVHGMSGLFGYVLARSSRSWTVRPAVTLAEGEKLNIAAEHEQGRVSSTAAIDAKSTDAKK